VRVSCVLLLWKFMVGSQIVFCFSIFRFFSWGGAEPPPQTSSLSLNTLAFISEIHPKRSQRDVSLHEKNAGLC